MRRSALAAAAATLVWGAPAAANSRFPASNQILFSPDDPELVVARTTYGILISRDGGTTFRVLCEDALGLPPSSIQDPVLALSSGALVAGLGSPVAGLDVSTDTGCSFTCAGGPLANQSVVDLAVRPGSGHAMLALTATLRVGDAASGVDARIAESTDDGAHWSLLGPALDPTLSPTTLEASASDAARLYVSATRGFVDSRTGSLLVSTDDGAHWTERPVPFDPSLDTSLYIGAVDPTDADRVYLRTSGTRSRLLVTADGGQTFQVASLALTGQMLGFALSPDGSTIHAGSIADGLFVGARSDLAFHKIASMPVHCLTAHGTDLWACSEDSAGFVVGVSADGGATFAPRLRLAGLAGPVACAPATSFACGADAGGSQCGGEKFQALCANLGGCAAPADAGPARSKGTTAAGGGCSLGGGRGTVAALAIVLLSVAFRLRRSR